jgi:hypothetical protein
MSLTFAQMNAQFRVFVEPLEPCVKDLEEYSKLLVLQLQKVRFLPQLHRIRPPITAAAGRDRAEGEAAHGLRAGRAARGVRTTGHAGRPRVSDLDPPRQVQTS